MSGSDRITWWEPRWGFVPRTRLALGVMGLTSPWVWIRIGVYAAVGALGIAAIARWVVPGTPQLPLWRLLMLVPMTWLILAMPAAALLLVPPQISVLHDRVVVARGQTPFVILFDKLHRASFDATDPLRVRLRLEYTGKHGCPGRITLGVGSKVDLTGLAELLEEKLAAREDRPLEVRPDVVDRRV